MEDIIHISEKRGLIYRKGVTQAMQLVVLKAGLWSPGPAPPPFYPCAISGFTVCTSLAQFIPSSIQKP